MLFTVGVEMPSSPVEAFGLVVPALCVGDYGCFSACDEQDEIPATAKDVILSIVEIMAENDEDIDAIKDAGFVTYSKDPEYSHCSIWCIVDVDLSQFSGKQKRINISIPESLIGRIDSVVATSHGKYKDRSHFLSIAARKQIEAA